MQSIADLSAEERRAVEVLHHFLLQRRQDNSSGPIRTPHIPRRSGSDTNAMQDVGNGDALTSSTSPFRREPDESKSTRALESHISNLEGRLSEAYREIRLSREERDEQRRIMFDAERRVNEVLQSSHSVSTLLTVVQCGYLVAALQAQQMTLYMDDLRRLHVGDNCSLRTIFPG